MKARVEIAGVTYAAETVDAEGLPPGVEMLRPSEDVGRRGDVTASEATTFFAKGTVLHATFDDATGYHRLASPPGVK